MRQLKDYCSERELEEKEIIKFPLQGEYESGLHYRAVFPVNQSTEVMGIPCHGFGSFMNCDRNERYKNLLLKAGMPVATFNFAGHGPDQGNSRDLTVTKMSENVLNLLEHFRQNGVDNFVIGANSITSLPIIKACAIDPRGVKAIVATSPIYYLDHLIRTKTDESKKWIRHEGLVIKREKFSDDYFQNSDLLKDVSKMNVPIINFVPERDPFSHDMNKELLQEIVKIGKHKGVNHQLIVKGGEIGRDHGFNNSRVVDKEITSCIFENRK